jgi:chloramphenicol O-acetyltransferase type A
MPRHLDVNSWARKELFDWFRRFDKPFFNVCVRLDITRLLAVVRQHPEWSVSLANHYLALRFANEIEPFHYRLRNDQVVVHEVINGGTTVLLPNDAFAIAYFDYDPDFAKFMTAAKRRIEEVRVGDGKFRPQPHDNVIHFTTLPWMAFTSFSHARQVDATDSVPKIAFGKFSKENDKVWLPFSVEVHHALMDGLHVGKYLNLIEEALLNPERVLMS